MSKNYSVLILAELLAMLLPLCLTAFAQVSLDWGDAMEPPLPTLLTNKGARHIIDGVTFLCATVDAETEGQASVNFMDDAKDGNDDNDGIKFTSPLIAGGIVMVGVTASVSGFLNTWIDFNCDCNWDDPGEQIFIDQLLVAGVNHLSFTIPQEATICPAYARFHFSTQPGLTPGGEAPDSEAEDYLVDIPLAVELTVFVATSGNGVAHLEWITESESENLGFHVYRSLTEQGEYKRITRGLIIGASNSTTAHTYRYIDRDVMLGYTYYYKLSNMDFNCNINYYGPISVTISGFPISVEKETIPENSSLAQNPPNP